MIQNRKTEFLIKAAALLGSAVFFLGLAYFAYAGTFSRWWADDYCYSATIRQLGLFSGIADWYQSSGNRLTTLIFVAFSDIFGWQSIRFIPLAVLSLWVAAWVFLLNQLRGLLRWEIQRYWLVLFALVQVYFMALLAPDRLQTLYWRMGTYHYSLPMPLLLINLGLLAGCFRLPCRRWAWVAIASGILGFLAAGLSETFAALQLGAILTGMLAALVFFRGEQRAHGLRLWLPALAATLLMMGLMKSAPANGWRQAVMPPPDNLLLIIPYSLRYAVDFIIYTIRGQVVPFAVFAALCAALALLAFPAQSVRRSARSLALGALLSLLLMYGLIVCSFAPSAYAALAYPAGRALMPGAFILLAGLTTTVCFAALALRQALPGLNHGWLVYAALALLVICSLYPIRAAAVTRKDVNQLATWSQRWDARHQQIQSAAAAGSQDIQTREIEVVQSLEDMGPTPGKWINACAAVLYNVRSITANP